MKSYILTKIDLLDAYIFADIFAEDKYQILSENETVDELMPLAIHNFKTANSQFKNWQQWQSGAEDGGYELEILRKHSSVFRASILLVDPIIEQAINLALKWHGGRARKTGTDTDMTHLLQVSNTLRLIDRSNPDKVLIASGLCHDLLEDTECPESAILKACGSEVLGIVKACSNDTALEGSKDWEQKKTKYIESVEKGGKKAMLVSLADKVANANALLELHKDQGDDIWKHFNRGKDKKMWFEKSVYRMMSKHIKDNSLLQEYGVLIKEMEQL